MRGDVVSTEDLVIDGQVKRTIELGNHSLTIGPGASVEDDVSTPRFVMAEGAILKGRVDTGGKK